MATFQVFDEARINRWLAVHALTTHTLKMGMVSSAQAVAQNDVAPRWSGGGMNYSANQVFGGNVPSGGNVVPSVTVAGDPTTLIDSADIVINQNASNPTNVRRSILYNDSTTIITKSAIGFVDWGADQDLSAGNNTIDTSNGFFDLVGN